MTMKVVFMDPWDDTTQDRHWTLYDVGEFEIHLAWELVRAGWAIPADPSAVVTPPGGPVYVTLADLEAYVPWAAERDGTARWWQRGSSSVPVSASSVPAPLTSNSEPLSAVVPACVLKVILAAAAAGPVTVQLTSTVGGVATVVNEVTVLGGQTSGSEVSEELIPQGAVTNLVVTAAPSSAVTGITAVAGAAEIEGVYTPA